MNKTNKLDTAQLFELYLVFNFKAMTKFEKDIIDAMVESPMAFSLLRKNAYNTKRVDRFVNKVWPSKRFNLVVGGKFKAIEFWLKVFETEMNIPNRDDRTEIYKTNYSFNEIEKELKKMNHLESTIEISDEANYILKVEFPSTRHIISIGGGMSFKPIDFLRIALNEAKNGGNNIKIKREGSRVNTKKALEPIALWLEDVLNNSKKKTNKKIKEAMNVGIEIEYAGVWLGKLEKSMLENGAVSFNSGYDGGETDGLYGDGVRLRENRLRINGHYGLPALKMLLVEMEARQCVLDVNSGIHYHVDCSTRDADRRLFSTNKEKITNIRKSLKINQEDKLNIICHVFSSVFRMLELRENTGKAIGYIFGNTRIQCKFETVEWRMIYPSLDYSSMVLQMLFCIHLTKVMTSNYDDIIPPVNEEYLLYLEQISKKIISNH